MRGIAYTNKHRSKYETQINQLNQDKITLQGKITERDQTITNQTKTIREQLEKMAEKSEVLKENLQ